MKKSVASMKKATVLVIEKDGEYFSRIEMLTGRIVFDRHLSIAWRTRDRRKAQILADAFDGNLALFNPIIWEVKVL